MAKEVSDEQKRRYLRAVKSIDKTLELHIITDLSTAFAVVACLQLALRHPENRGVSAKLAEAFAKGIVLNVTQVSPDLGELLDLGFDPAYDS